ncbi:Hsp20/alpha crystallin family protein [Streptomyces sp. NPDC006458]|uniref:Hsp20/alpha crystallin family protein n=1 Tax=Streptomyces sp. NPDC006458 TaxID=3154302 RepID=UPI0033A54575
MAGRLEHSRNRFPELADWISDFPGFGDFPRLPARRPAFGRHIIPIEVTRGEAEYVLKAELPGMDPDDDISITVDGDTLIVSAEHEESSETKDHSEFRYGSFVRTVRLPQAITAEDVRAEYADGVLTVRAAMPKPREAGARTVPVTRAAGPAGGGEAP